jgi:hypothetical protein
MIYKTDEEVKVLVKAFEERTLSKEEWTHAAHLTVGLYYCLNYPFAAAKNWMTEGILRLNDAHGTPNTETSGYHETLTMFWLLTIEEFVGKTKYETLAETANRLIACCDTKLPLKFYSRELLFSPEARARYVKPDLNELPVAPNKSAFSI